jgi:hypothetical protein
MECQYPIDFDILMVYATDMTDEGIERVQTPLPKEDADALDRLAGEYRQMTGNRRFGMSNAAALILSVVLQDEALARTYLFAGLAAHESKEAYSVAPPENPLSLPAPPGEGEQKKSAAGKKAA